MTNFEPSRYNLLAVAQREIPILGKKLIQKPAPEAEDQAALSAPSFSQSQQSSNSLPPYFLTNLQPLPSQPSLAQPLPSYNNLGFGEPSFYRPWPWPCPWGNPEQKVQFGSKLEIVNGLMHLANSAAN